MYTPDYRHEYKHCINLSDYYSLRPRLQTVAITDPNTGPDGRYHVRSLYFDNDEDKALREKIAGLANREKFRIRLYNGDSSFIRLEKKSKANGLNEKHSAPITVEECQRMIDGDIDWMEKSPYTLIVELYSKIRFQRLKPKTIVDYWREAYVYPAGNVRITFDSDIRTGLFSTNILDPNLPLILTGEPGLLLLEVKFDHFFPDIMRDIIQTGERCSASFSKYAACRTYG